MRRSLLIIVAAAVATPGCGTLLAPGGGRTTWSDSARAVRRDMAAGWDAARVRFDRMCEEIRKDLTLHENEGLEAFGPGTVEQVRRMRRDMNAESQCTPGE